MADHNTIARPYAQALFEVANEAGTLDSWSEALAAASDLMADGQVVTFLRDPALDDPKRLEFLKGLFDKAGISVLGGADAKGMNFLRVLVDNGRVNVLPEIAEQYEALKAQVQNTVDVTVTSATPVSDDRLKAISAALEKRLGRDVNIATEIDETLIGGAVIKAGDIVIDGSMRARLAGLTNALIT